jgi:GNAT superfamily N-acetyltransferase
MNLVRVNDSMFLRRMEREDIASVREILAGAFDSERLGDEVAEDLRAHCDRGQHGLALDHQREAVPTEYWVLQEAGGGPPLCITGLYRFEWAWDRCFWLGWFAVAPDRMNQGIGSAALQTVLRIARAKGCEVFKVETGRGSRAIPFYKRHGFVEEAVLRRHYSRDLDAQVLARDMEDIVPAEVETD